MRKLVSIMLLTTVLFSCKEARQVSSTLIQNTGIRAASGKFTSGLTDGLNFRNDASSESKDRTDYWLITYLPGNPFDAPVTVSFFATYYGTASTPGGTLYLEFRNANSTCHYASPGSLSPTLPANPYNGQTVALGTADMYNTCGVNKIIKFIVEDPVGGIPVEVASVNNTITP